jgi:hypothetical protein
VSDEGSVTDLYTSRYLNPLSLTLLSDPCLILFHFHPAIETV